MKLKIIIASICIFSIALLPAQTKEDSVVNRSVTVERDFQPVIQDAGKIVTTPIEIEPQVDKTAPKYADFAPPVKTDYVIKSLDPELLVHQPNETMKGYLRLGIGYPLNTLNDFLYPLVKNKNNRLDFSIRHLGAFGDKTNVKTTADLQYDHLFNNFSIFAGIKGRHDYFNYYGRWYGANGNSFIMSDAASRSDNQSILYTSPNNKTVSLYDLSAFPLNETFWHINSHIGAKSLPESYGVSYLFDFQYNIFQSVKQKMNENELTLTGKFEVPFNDSFFGMNMDISNINYSINSTDSINFPQAYSVLKFNPYYKITGDAGFLKLGVKTGISPNHGQLFTPSPDVEGQWNLINEYLAVYGGITGDLQINTMSKMYDENRYLYTPLRLDDLYTPIDVYAGIKFKPMYNLLFDFYGEYKVIHNQYFFTNKHYSVSPLTSTTPANLDTIYQNRFDVIYAGAIQRSIGARIEYNYKKQVNVFLKGAYNLWDVNNQAYAWQMPKWNVDFGANAEIMKDVNVSTQIFFQDGRYAKLGNKAISMTPTLDINLAGDYTFNNNVSFFVKLNNLLNRHYDIYYGYEVQGINGMAGVIFSF